jgi:hypothetical protein
MTGLEGLIWCSFCWSNKRGVLKASRVRSRTATIRVEDTPYFAGEMGGVTAVFPSLWEAKSRYVNVINKRSVPYVR